ncbi:deoxyribonuclease TATDN1 [Chironomus tepperi]|uniref:deoxyribonuclease TATDN1 n=1 Tax=Chironomus tepperi TaxID=113505 RepID=UPI00391F9761
MIKFFQRSVSLINQRKMKFIDIGANLTDEVYDGRYSGSRKHEIDRQQVLDKAWNVGVEKIILTVGSILECAPAFKIASNDDRLFCTTGCHPTRCGEFLVDSEYLNKLDQQIEENIGKVVAIGEIGLDYDRLHFCEPDIQKKYFEKQLELADKYDLPLFLHCRNAHDDFIKIIENNKSKIRRGGVVHTYDGTLEHANKLIEMGFHIGLNGCSLKTEANLEVVKNLPNDKIMLETDAPWCEIRPTHASYKYVKTKFETVKKQNKQKWQKDVLVVGRNEPCTIVQVLEVIAGVKGEDAEKLGEIFYNNTMKVFFSD